MMQMFNVLNDNEKRIFATFLKKIAAALLNEAPLQEFKTSPSSHECHAPHRMTVCHGPSNVELGCHSND